MHGIVECSGPVAWLATAFLRYDVNVGGEFFGIRQEAVFLKARGNASLKEGFVAYRDGNLLWRGMRPYLVPQLAGSASRKAPYVSRKCGSRERCVGS